MVSSIMRPLFLPIVVILGIGTPLFANAQINSSLGQEEKLAELEASSSGRLGVFALNTANNQSIQYRAEERFPMHSTSKAIVAAAILKQSMTDNLLLQQKITYSKEDLANLGYIPITQQHIASGMTIQELCAAAMLSDDGAMNFLMKQLGGPSAVTAFARSIGDQTFRLDRYEPELNSAPGDIRDTTTPAAMADSLQRLTLGDALGQPQRAQFQTWLKDNTTGDRRIRAGVPKGWVVGDKTGGANYGTTNDIGVIWPPNCAPIVVTIFYTETAIDAPRREDIVAKTTQILVDEFAKTDPCLNSKSS